MPHRQKIIETLEAHMNAKNISIAALVCGILGIVGSFIPVVSYFTLVLAILGIVFGVKGRKAEGNDKKGMATAGMVLGIIGVACSVIMVLCVACAVGVAAVGAAA